MKKKKIEYKFVSFLFLAFFGLMYVLYINRVSYNIPHMDAWKGLAELTETYMQGNLTFYDWVPIPHGEYFSLLGTPIYYTVIVLLKMNYQLMTYAASFFLLLESVVVYKAYCRAGFLKENRSKQVYHVLFVLLLFAIYNLNQWEIACFYVAFEFFLRISFYCYMFSYIDKMLHKAEKRMKDYVYGGVLTVIAIIVISHAYFPGAIATVALTMIYDYFHKRDWKAIKYYLVVAFFVIGAGICYLATYQTSQINSNVASGGVFFLEKLIKITKAFFIMAAAPLIHQSSTTLLWPYYCMGVMNVAVSVFCMGYYFKRKKYRNSYMPAMLILYGYVSILIIACIRLRVFDLNYMVSSRYVVETTLILVGNIWILIEMLTDAMDKSKLSKQEKARIGVVGILLTVLTISVVQSDLIEWRAAPYRKNLFKQAAYNMLNIDYVSDEDLVIAQAPAQNVREAVEVLDKYDLSVFHDVKTSKELQQMQINSEEPYTYIRHKGIFSDSWLSPEASFYIHSGAETELVLEGTYPFEITGQEKVTIIVNDVITEYRIFESDFAIEIIVPPNELSLVTIKSDFYKVVDPDTRELAFVFKRFVGYTARN